jgi:hypothetical protein
MRRCQTARQYQRSQLQLGFFLGKSPKLHLKILGSLIFCSGLTLSDSAWSVPPINDIAVSESKAQQKSNLRIVATSLDTDVLSFHPEVLPPEVMGEAVKEWSQPVYEDKGDKGDKEVKAMELLPQTSHLPDFPSPTPQPSSLDTPQQTIASEQKPEFSFTVSDLPIETENLSNTERQPSPSETNSELEPTSSEIDPELGKLRLRELPPPPSPSKSSVYLLGGAGYFRSDNIFSGVDPIDDGLFRSGLTILAAPSLGEQTTLFASVGGNIIRYGKESEYDYNELDFNVAVRQRIGQRSYGELGWRNRQLFSQSGGDRFLDDHSFYLELGRRDSLAQKLSLDTFYQVRLSLANPSDRSQVINYLGASLGYDATSALRLALDYQFVLADFTQQDRLDQYHQLLARFTYDLSPNVRTYLYGGRSFGQSSDSEIDFDGFVFGAGVNFNLTLF